MNTIIGLENKRNILLCGKNGLETRNHISLGHPADIAFLSVSSRVLV